MDFSSGWLTLALADLAQVRFARMRILEKSIVSIVQSPAGELCHKGNTTVHHRQESIIFLSSTYTLPLLNLPVVVVQLLKGQYNSKYFYSVTQSIHRQDRSEPPNLPQPLSVENEHA